MQRRCLILISCMLGSSCTVTTETPRSGKASTAKEQPATKSAEARTPAAKVPTPTAPTADVAPAAPTPAAPTPAALPAAPSSDVETAIELLAPGRDPRTPLRWSAKPGTEQRLTLTLRPHMKVELEGSSPNEQDLPPLTLVLVGRVAEPAAGGAMHLVLEVASAEYDPSVGDERIHKSMERSLEVLRTLRVELDLDERGVASHVQAAVPERGLSDLRPAIESVLLVIPHLFVPSPEQPVGAGAKWKSTTGLAFAGFDLRQTAETSLVSRTGATTELAWSISQAHTRVVPGGPRPIEGLSVTAKGTLAVANDQPLATRAKSTIQAKLQSHVQGNGPALASTMTLDIEFEAALAK